MKTIISILLTLVVLALLAAGVVYSGSFNIAADDPNWGMTSSTIESMRDRSIARQSGDIAVPATLEDSKTIANGASEYAEMCTACHLAPGMKDTELRKGLYPMPPELAKRGAHRSPSEQFWIIKHGLKRTGMPAWGLTHDDDRIWSLVAFVRKLPGLTPSQYQELVASGAGGHSHEQGAHSHDASKATASLPSGANDAAAVVDLFQKYLAQGKTRDATGLLDPNVLIFEGGGAERSRDEYASYHLKADAEFLKTAKVAVTNRTGTLVGDLAWIATESRLEIQGANPVDVVMTETMVLKNTAEGWRITHIHWSSK